MLLIITPQAVCGTRYTREYWTIYRGPGFLAFVWFGSTPNPLLPPLPSVSSTGDTQEDWEREATCWRQRREGVAVEPNHTTARSLALYKSFNPLCATGIKSCSGCCGTLPSSAFRIPCSVFRIPCSVFRFYFITSLFLSLATQPRTHEICFCQSVKLFHLLGFSCKLPGNQGGRGGYTVSPCTNYNIGQAHGKRR